MQRSIVIQNADVNATKAAFSHLHSNELLVHGHFHTIQGEGPFTGHPAFFIRLGGCNFGAKDIACAACDTSFHLGNSRPTSFDELRTAYLSDGSMPFLIVITGGEPCLQANLPAFVSYLRETLPAVSIQIETNGSQANVMLACANAGAYIVCSPKAVLGRFAPPPCIPKTNVKATATERVIPRFVYKFVVTSNEDDAHNGLPTWVKDVPPQLVYVSPCTVYARAYAGEISSAWDPQQVDQVRTSANYAYAAQLVLKHGYNLSVQVHTFLSVP